MRPRTGPACEGTRTLFAIARVTQIALDLGFRERSTNQVDIGFLVFDQKNLHRASCGAWSATAKQLATQFRGLLRGLTLASKRAMDRPTGARAVERSARALVGPEDGLAAPRTPADSPGTLLDREGRSPEEDAQEHRNGCVAGHATSAITSGNCAPRSFDSTARRRVYGGFKASSVSRRSTVLLRLSEPVVSRSSNARHRIALSGATSSTRRHRRSRCDKLIR